jgi:hypothetical protein
VSKINLIPAEMSFQVRGLSVMAEPGTWRNLRSIMFVTFHVAAVVTAFRYLAGADRSSTSPGLWLVIALFSAVTWPIGPMILASFNSRGDDVDRTCPLCRRGELRPLVKAAGGLFQPVSSYRCAACWAIIRTEGESRVIEPYVSNDATASSSGIRFVDESTTDSEIRFLDDLPESLA